MMIDLHSHCLPGIDDGARDLKESIAMLSDSYTQGVEICVATPHFEPLTKNEIDVFSEKRQKSFELLQGEINNTGIQVPELLLGAEVYLYKDISEYEDLDKLCISNTNYMLIELSTRTYSSDYSEWLYSLSLKNIIPILAHVERYPYFDHLLNELSDIDYLCQINAQTLLKRKGRKLLKNLIESGYEVVVASDMHNMGLRKNRMKDAFETVRSHFPGSEHTLFGNKQRYSLNSIK